jgi:hypothetical protein
MEAIVLDEQKEFDGKVFPLALSPTLDVPSSKLVDLLSIEKEREKVLSLLKVHKGILFRGFGLQTAEDFHAVVESLQLKSMAYLGELKSVYVY